MKRFLSLGAGVQSSALLLMMKHGDAPMADAAVFADTQAEPASVYRWLLWLEQRSPIPIHRITAGSLEADSQRIRVSRKTGNVYVDNLIPAFVDRPGKVGLMARRCTADYKVAAIHRAYKKMAGLKRGVKNPEVISYIGISTDEAHRMKPARDPWLVNAWPLIDLGLSRQDCLSWMAQKGYPEPPRSSCVFCPFHSDDEWRRLMREEPSEFARAVQFERSIQEANTHATGTAKLAGAPYLHSSLKPLDQVEFKTDGGARDHFGNECEGLCGV